MRTLSISATLLGAVSLSACVSASSPVSYGSRSQDYYDFIEDLGLKLEEIEPVNFLSFDPGEGVYKGVLLGSDEFNSELSPIKEICEGAEFDGGCQWTGLANYIADASLYISLEGQDPKEGMDFTGDFTNFYTLLTGLSKLDGKVDFSGVITELELANHVIFSVLEGSGTLKSGTQNIFIVEVEDGAILVGDGGSFAAGAIRNNFTRVADNQILYWDAGIFLARQ